MRMLLPLINHLAAGSARLGSGGCPSQSKCQLWGKLTLNCAAQQNGADPPLSITGRPVIGRSVTGTDIPGRGNHAFGMVETAGLAKWRSRPIPAFH